MIGKGNMMIRVAICDDDQVFAGYVESLCIELAKCMGVKVDTEVYPDGTSLLEGIEKGNRYELLFLDIEMKKMGGIETAHRIRERSKSVLIIYISSHEQYLKELFEVEPFRFLSKPLDEELFKRYFEESVARIEEGAAFFQYKQNKSFKKVAFRDIVYFESQYRIIRIVFSDGTEDTFYGKLNNIEVEVKAINQSFLRIHQSYFVNYSYITKSELKHVTVSYGKGKEDDLKISEERRKELHEMMRESVRRKVDTK